MRNLCHLEDLASGHQSLAHTEFIIFLQNDNTFLFLQQKFSQTGTVHIPTEYIQGADDKLGQFLSQDIWATANHRNCLQHSLESCASLL